MCETNIDDCTPNPCLNNGTCTDGVNTFTCDCVAGFTGDRCEIDIDNCTPNSCLNDGTCTDGVNTFTCDCVAGYTGDMCETDIDNCTPNPCLNNGTCTDGVNTFTCDCVAGYTGDMCEVDINDCNPNPCLNEGTCTDGVNTFTCDCVAGYTGDRCEIDINDCNPNPCLNDGMCTDGVNTFTCDCIPGYTGDMCETDIDDCNPNLCLNDGVCTDGVNTFTCDCVPGYTGDMCETDIDDCNPDPCLNDGTCTDGVNTFTCDCVTGFTGDRCEIDIDNCTPNSCLNDGTCTDGVNTFTCDCVAGYTGDMCETDIDNCAPNPCLNEGTCTDGVNTFTCDCVAGFTGDTCVPVPGIVQNIATTAPSEDVLMITWDPPTEMSAFMIAGYQVHVDTANTTVYDAMVSETSVQVPNLARYIPYYISVVVMTTLSASSAEASAIAFTLQGTPTVAPSGTAVDRTSGTTMIVSWVPITLEEARGFVAGYDLSYEPSNSRKRQTMSVRAPGDSSEYTLTGLEPAASYSVSVSAATVVGSGPASQPVASPATCPFQIHFFGADKCEDLRSDPALNDIIQAILTRTNPLCQCDLVKEQITDSLLKCNTDPNAITFRAAMLGNDLANCSFIVNRVEQWVTTADTKLTAQGTELTTNTECPVGIASFDDEYCDVDVSAVEKARIVRIAAPSAAVVVVVVVCVVIVIAVAIILNLRRRKKLTYEVFRDQNETGSINALATDGQYRPVGASFKSENEGIIAYAVGEDSGKVTGTQYEPAGGVNFLNPLYQQEEKQQTEPEYAKVDLAAKKKARDEQEPEIEKMKLEMESASFEVSGPIENPYECDPVPFAMTKAQEAGYEEPK